MRRNPDDKELLARLTVETDDDPRAMRGKVDHYLEFRVFDEGRLAATATFRTKRKYMEAVEVIVNAPWRRRGVASWLYRYAQNRTGLIVKHSKDQTLDGRAFAKGRRRNPKMGSTTVPGWVVQYCRENYDRLTALGFDLSKPPYGAGHFGVVFPYKPDPRFVAKVTRDPAEGPAARKMIKLQAEGAYGVDGAAIFKSVEAGPPINFRGKIWPTFLIIRENVEPLKYEDSLYRIFGALSDGQEAARKYASLKTERKRDMWYQEYVSAMHRVSSVAPYLGEFMMAAIDYFGAPLTDVHAKNVGKTITNWGDDVRPPGTIVAFDLGHTAPTEE